MGSIADGFSTWLRDYVTDGVPASGQSKPAKADGRAIGGVIEAYIADKLSGAAAASGSVEIIRNVTTATGAVTVGAAIDTFRLPRPMHLTGVRASLTAASSSGDVTVNIKAGGVSILSTILHVDAGAKTSVGSATPAVISTLDLADDTEITIDVVAAGTGATGLRVTLLAERTDFGVATTPYFVGYASDEALDSLVPYPAGIAANDIAIIQVGYWAAALTANILRPSGWTTLINPIDTVSGHASFGDYYYRSAVFWKRLDGTESGNVAVTYDATTGGFSSTIMSVWRGCIEAGSPFEAVATEAGISGAMAGADVTTAGPSRLVVSLYEQAGNTTSGPDVGFTEAFNIHYDVGPTPIASFCASVQPAPITATTVAAESRTRVIDGLPNWTSCSFALIPVPA